MKPIFAIDRDNGIRLLDPDEKPRVDEVICEDFDELVSISQARNLSKADVTEMWNAFAGTPRFEDCHHQKQFKNRLFGLQRIWQAIQRLAEPEKPAENQPEPTAEPATMEPVKEPKAKRARKPAAAKEKKPKAERKHRPRTERTPRVKGESQKDKAAALLLRKSGVTEAELTEKIGWNHNSVTMFIQWLRFVCAHGITKLQIETNGKGERVYKAVA